jgi:hypothetical protein
VDVIVIALMLLAFYFLPAILAWSKSDFWAIFALNLFLGWTLLGWVVALAWALKGRTEASTGDNKLKRIA